MGWEGPRRGDGSVLVIIAMPLQPSCDTMVRSVRFSKFSTANYFANRISTVESKSNNRSGPWNPKKTTQLTVPNTHNWHSAETARGASSDQLLISLPTGRCDQNSTACSCRNHEPQKIQTAPEFSGHVAAPFAPSKLLKVRSKYMRLGSLGAVGQRPRRGPVPRRRAAPDSNCWSVYG